MPNNNYWKNPNIYFTDTPAYKKMNNFVFQIVTAIKNYAPTEEGDNSLLCDDTLVLEELGEMELVVKNTPLGQPGRYSNTAMKVVIGKLGGEERSEYFRESFGNKMRMDYGTGHEFNFLCYIYETLLLRHSDQHHCDGVVQGRSSDRVEENCDKKTGQNENKEEDLDNGKDEYKGRDKEEDLDKGEDEDNGKDEYKGRDKVEDEKESDKTLTNKDLQSNTKELLNDDLDLLVNQNIKFILSNFIHYTSLIDVYLEKFTIESAGGKGVWGVDNYQLLKYVFGSAILNNDLIIDKSFWIKCIMDPSPMLQNILNLNPVALNNGLLEMYDKEVFHNKMAMQHFIYSGVLEEEEHQHQQNKKDKY